MIFGGIVGVVLGALLFAGALADGGEASWIGLVAGRCARRWAGSPSAAWSSGRARRLDGGAAALITVYADIAALVLAALAIFVPPLSFLALIGFVVLLPAGGGARARSTPACGSCANHVAAKPKKLVLAVIDSLKPEHARPGHRRGPRAGAGGAGGARHLHPRLRLDLPLGHARGVRRDRHRIRARPSTTSRR